MRPNSSKSTLTRAALTAAMLLAGGAAFAQTINLNAGPATAAMPDGSAVPMWGYSCGAAASGSSATCASLNPNAAAGTWSPVVITVPYSGAGTSLTINLTNKLAFTPPGGSPNYVPTSITIVGQLGGGLGQVGAGCSSGTTCTASPAHGSQAVTWSTVGSSPAFTPPSQAPRAQSFGTEVAPAGASLATGQVASGSALIWSNLNPGTYLIESGTHPSIQGAMGLYGILVVTTPPSGGTAGIAYPAAGGSPVVNYNAEIPVLFGEIDPVQNSAVSAAVNTTGFSETNVWSGQPGQCGNPLTATGAANPTYNTCYPPAVNYTPLYYTINGVGFDRTHASNSVFPTLPATNVAPGGSVLVRLVNAGLKMHVPSIVGAQTTQLTLTTAATASTTAVPGFSLIAEDGNRLPGVPHVQNDVFMAAGKTYDVMINVPASGASALPIFDRELSLSGNAIERDAGMLAYISVNAAAAPATSSSSSTAQANPDTYNSIVTCTVAPCAPVVVKDPGKGVIANDVNVYGVALLMGPSSGTVVLNHDGTFSYTPNANTTSDSFTYCANGTVTGTTCSSGLTATVTFGALAAPKGETFTVQNQTFTATMAGYMAQRNPGLLTGALDSANYAFSLNSATVTGGTGLALMTDANGGFSASVGSGATGTACPSGTVNATCFTVTFNAKNTLGELSNSAAATLIFPAGSGLQVTVLDGYDHQTQIKDYRWVIEEDQTFYVDPTKTTNTGTSIVPTFGVNFHTSHMPFVAQGCTGQLSCEGGQMMIDTAPLCTSPGVPAGCSATGGQHINVVCDVGDGACRPDATGQGFTAVDPSQVVLDPHKRYYISVLPGDSANPFAAGYSGIPCGQPGADPTKCQIGHGMGGAPIGIDPNTGLQAAAVTILTQPSPYPPGKLSVFVFEDDFPLNGEHDAGGLATDAGGNATLAPNEPGLANFQIHLWDAMGGNGDFTGQMTYDMFNMPLTNSLDGTIDPASGFDACPITQQGLAGNAGISGMIVTCPKYESDGQTLSPLAGQAVVANLMPGRWGVIATPGADRIARGEEWLQTNTLDGQKAHDSFTRIGEPSFFQEFGPASFHVSIGFANPAIINSRLANVCNGSDVNITGNCTPGNTLTGRVVGERLSRAPDERLYGSGSHDAYAWTQCYVSVGDPDGEDFAFAKCGSDGTFTLTGLPDGDWRITTFDQWNDQLVDGLSTPVRLGSASQFCSGAGSTQHVCNFGDIAATQWETNLQTRTFIDDNKDGIAQATETGIPFANVAVRLRDGSLENLLATDFTGTANFNETFPLFSWYTVETDVTRYKNTGTHVVYDAGGPADGTLTTCGGTLKGDGYPSCGQSVIGKNLANTSEQVSVPTNLRVPGSVYCADADCSNRSISATDKGGISGNPNCTYNPASGSQPQPSVTCDSALSTGRIDNPWYGGVEGWQGFPGQFSFLEFGKAPYAAGENGGIEGHVVYASTRPFDDPQMLVQTQWEPLVPHVTINLYQEGFASDGVTPTLTLVDTTQTSSFDDWAQGFRSDGVPNMNCPGQTAADLFYFTLLNQPQYLDWYNKVAHGTAGNPTSLPYGSQFKCYDGMHNWNQLQPTPYDGQYQFPSITARDASSGRPTASNCKICQPNTAADTSDVYYGTPMLPAGKYVVEVVLPPGFELVKEEDKNILIGDQFIAPAQNEFGSLSNVFIVPDQASVAASQQYAGPGYNTNNAQNSTQGLGASPQNGIVPGFVPEPIWPCVGEKRIVPDYISLYPQTHQVAPFAGASRSLCDRKEVMLTDQTHAIAKFFVYTSTHIASKFTGGITDDYTSEFDPFSPQFGEKFAPPDLPVSIKDWAGNEISRVYADQWGAYNGMTYSTWEVNPPNPTGYSPTMMVMCMNDPGPIMDTRMGSATNGKLITDPLFSQGYSQFCYELPFMPGTTQYLDTPVVPTSAFAGAGYNNVDCAYPNLTPAIREVDGDGVGPWVSAANKTLTITALGDEAVSNNAYNGPSATGAPYNQKTVTRHYGFGNNQGSVTIGGINVTNFTTWSDQKIVLSVPQGVPNCAVQQQVQYNTHGAAQCGQLVVTTAPATAGGQGVQSIDTVTVTIGGNPPTHIGASASIQTAIDQANPGDLLIVDPTCQNAGGTWVDCASPAATQTTGTHSEMVIMWKPVRLQGVGAVSSVINANTHPAGKMDPWRRQVDCLFGLAINGYTSTGSGGSNPYDASSDTANGGQPYSCPGTGWKGFAGNTPIPNSADGSLSPQVDRLPLEAVIGWDAEQNGNLAELLQEPALMGALEGAGITVLAKGVVFPNGATNIFGAGGTTAGAYPTGTRLLTSNDCSNGPGGSNPYPSNFLCNPSSIDGLSITNSSQGGGGIFIHAWGHNLQIANNRIYNNSGTLAGGINVGQGEYPPSYIKGGALNTDPGSCDTSIGLNLATGMQEPYCQNLWVNMHHNAVLLNDSTGDELFSATPAGAGGVSICTGADYYKFNYNWVCGNLSSGDGGGIGHIGYSWNGDIEHNTVIFNQSLNPTIPTNGGGIVAMGAPDADPACSQTNDQDCVSAPGSIGPSDGVGPNLVINANLLMGNAAEAGSGGGIAFQNVNGSDVLAFPGDPSKWNHVVVTNNIIADNVAGWDGGGVSFLDALNLDFVHNTVVANSTTATAGVLNNTLGAPLASTQNTTNNCSNNCGTASVAQPAGVVSIQNSAVLAANINQLPAGTPVKCPAGHYAGTGTGLKANCTTYSYPMLANNILWQNSAYQVGVGSLSPQYQQNIVTLYNAAFSGTPGVSVGSAVANQMSTGQCLGGSSYWDIGVRGDTGPADHSGGTTLNPQYSLLTSSAGYSATNFTQTPGFISQYCDGARQPPESVQAGGTGWAVPPGISDATVPNPVFNLTPVATVDEGNNWINLRWGPLTLVNPLTGATLGNYSPANPLDDIPASQLYAPATLDFFGNLRLEPGESTMTGKIDAGAIEVGSVPPRLGATVTPPGPVNFVNVPVKTTSAPITLMLMDTGDVDIININVTFTGPFARATGTATDTCKGTLVANANGTTNCGIAVVFNAPTNTGTSNGSVKITGTQLGTPVSITVQLTGQAVAAGGNVTLTPLVHPYGTVKTGTNGSTQLFTLTNNLNVNLTGIQDAALSNSTDFTIVQNFTTCGPVQPGRVFPSVTTLAPGHTCNVYVRFNPKAPGLGKPAGAVSSTLSITDSAGTQSTTANGLTGTGN